jgi:hypothetical protein
MNNLNPGDFIYELNDTGEGLFVYIKTLGVACIVKLTHSENDFETNVFYGGEGIYPDNEYVGMSFTLNDSIISKKLYVIPISSVKTAEDLEKKCLELKLRYHK